MKKNVFLIIPSLAFGGGERVFSIIANSLNRDYFNVTLVTLTESKLSFILRSDIHLIQLNRNRSLFAIFSLFSLLKNNKPDVVCSTLYHSNIIVGFIKIVSSFFNLLPNTKFVLRESSIVSINIRYSTLPSFLIKPLIRFIYPQFDCLIAQSADMAIDLINNFGIDKHKIRVINNPINIESDLVPSKRNNTNEMANFITVGNLRPEKGHLRLIEILNNIKGIIDFKYLIVGDGPEREIIQERINAFELNEQVEIVGHKNNVYEYLNNADFFLQGSFVEGFPNALLESCLFGVPVIAFNVFGGTKEIIINGFNGFLIDDFDNSEFSKTLLKIRDYEFNRKSISDDVKLRFNLPKVLNDYENIFLKR